MSPFICLALFIGVLWYEGAGETVAEVVVFFPLSRGAFIVTCRAERETEGVLLPVAEAEAPCLLTADNGTADARGVFRQLLETEAQ